MALKRDNLFSVGRRRVIYLLGTSTAPYRILDTLLLKEMPLSFLTDATVYSCISSETDTLVCINSVNAISLRTWVAAAFIDVCMNEKIRRKWSYSMQADYNITFRETNN